MKNGELFWCVTLDSSLKRAIWSVLIHLQVEITLVEENGIKWRSENKLGETGAEKKIFESCMSTGDSCVHKPCVNVHSPSENLSFSFVTKVRTWSSFWEMKPEKLWKGPYWPLLNSFGVENLAWVFLLQLENEFITMAFVNSEAQ